MSEQNTVRVAAASDNGALVDQHFGYATHFRIYEIDERGETRYIETRETPSWCKNTEAQASASEPFEAALALLHDCQIVLANRFGPCAANALSDKGISYYEYDGAIDNALSRLSKAKALVGS
jgi:predicted Fe-Mo cluster-binding NifX family protein